VYTVVHLHAGSRLQWLHPQKRRPRHLPGPPGECEIAAVVIEEHLRRNAALFSGPFRVASSATGSVRDRRFEFQRGRRWSDGANAGPRRLEQRIEG
jgi:hypothetical protein